MKLCIFPAVLLTACAAVALAGEKADDQKKLFQEYVEKYGAPGPEHRLLEPLVGNYQAKVKMWFDPSEPPQVSDGTVQRKSIMGGRFVQTEVEGKMLDKPYQGQGTMGYDRAKRKFVCTWLDSASTAVHQSFGTYDESNKTWTFKSEEDCPITGKRVKVRDTLQIVNADEQKLEMYRQLGDDKEVRMMEIVLTRKR